MNKSKDIYWWPSKQQLSWPVHSHHAWTFSRSMNWVHSHWSHDFPTLIYTSFHGNLFPLAWIWFVTSLKIWPEYSWTPVTEGTACRLSPLPGCLASIQFWRAQSLQYPRTFYPWLTFLIALICFPRQRWLFSQHLEQRTLNWGTTCVRQKDFIKWR